jgi:FemAB-related protein (PEP-CTERM system-associated)
MPFLDGGGPCSSSSSLTTALVEALVLEARRAGAARVEVRTAQKLDIAAQPREHKVNMILPLPDDARVLWDRLDGSVRNQVRKAQRSGLSIDAGGADRLDDFYAICAARMRDLGSPAHDRAFFSATLDRFGAQARVMIVRNGTTPIGGLMALAFKDTIVVPWAACLKEHLRLCPNMFLYWETMRASCGEGFRQFDFGRSTRGSGTYHFKRQWGAVESPLFWYSLPTGARDVSAAPAGDGKSAARLVNLWRRLPLPLTRYIGPYVRRYLIQ